MKNTPEVYRETWRKGVFLSLFIFSIIAITSVNAQSQWIWQEEDGPANTWMAFRKTINVGTVPSEALVNIGFG